MNRVLLTLIACTALNGAACTTDVEVDNLPSTVVSVGPVWVVDDVLYVEFRSWDHEGDDVSLELLTGATAATLSPVPASSLAPYSLTDLPSERFIETAGLVGLTLAGAPAPAVVGIRVAGDPATALWVNTAAP